MWFETQRSAPHTEGRHPPSGNTAISARQRTLPGSVLRMSNPRLGLIRIALEVVYLASTDRIHRSVRGVSDQSCRASSQPRGMRA
jgi:hypothetical protein